jgi:hypothetical protein
MGAANSVLRRACAFLGTFVLACALLGNPPVVPEEAKAFEALIRDGFVKNSPEELLQAVWWRGADAPARRSLSVAFQELAKYKVHSMRLRELGPEDSLLDGSDRSIVTDLPVRAVLAIELAVADGPDGIFLFEYPIGRSDGKLWILPVVDRSRR